MASPVESPSDGSAIAESTAAPGVGTAPAGERLSERACRQTIANHRRRVDLILHLPDWEDFFREGLAELGLPEPRRGINLRSVLESLLIEHKVQLIRWSFQNFQDRFPAKEALRLCDQFGLELWKAKELDEMLSERQWESFRDALLGQLKNSHRKYKRAQTTLFRRYQSLLHTMVKRQVFDPNKRPDALQEASLGLVHAIDKVEDSRASFGSYARSWISRQIRNYLMSERFPVHVPINLASKLLRNQSEGKVDEENPEDAGDLASRYSDLLKPNVALDAPVEDDESPRFQLADGFTASPLEDLSTKDLHDALKRLIEGLTTKQREVLARRFGLGVDAEPQTLAKIALEVGISHQQVSMREKRALQKLEMALKPLYQEMYG